MSIYAIIGFALFFPVVVPLCFGPYVSDDERRRIDKAMQTYCQSCQIKNPPNSRMCRECGGPVIPPPVTSCHF